MYYICGSDGGEKTSQPSKKTGASSTKKRLPGQGTDSSAPAKKIKTKGSAASGGPEGKKVKKKKKPKDAPKKALSAFIVYSNENRAKVQRLAQLPVP